MTDFDAVESLWSERLGSLRNLVRQHVIREQLREHTADVGTVLDVGCGQGTQALELAGRGHRVTGVDPSADLLRRMSEQARIDCLPVDALQGRVEDLGEVLGDRTFDLVCAHGLLMYLPDAPGALATLAARTQPGGLLSFTFRNGDALAYRPGVRGQWRAALAAFDASRYVNELGAQARADRLEEVLGWCARLDLQIVRWYGVRVLTDGRAADEPPDPETLADCFAAELEAGRRDPYRQLGSQIHVVARR